MHIPADDRIVDMDILLTVITDRKPHISHPNLTTLCLLISNTIL